MKAESPIVYDILGIGFGPSNLALAIAIEWSPSASIHTPLRTLFFEKQKRFGWHRGMLIEGTTMQVSFLLEDLVTMRNRTSPVFGSGYNVADPIRHFSDFAGKCIRDSFGQLHVARNYHTCTSEDVECGIHLPGSTEHIHGLSSRLLSSTAVRAGEILEAMTWERNNTKIYFHA